MIVYHGTNQDIDIIDLTAGSRFKDFGRGFYVTPDKQTATRMAEKKCRFFGGQATIIEYEFDESVFMSEDLNTLEFPERATADWIKFIARNRDRRCPESFHNYDIIKGPIADDGVALQLGRLSVHVEQADSIALDLQDKYLDQQIFFGTPKSLKFLKKKSICQTR